MEAHDWVKDGAWRGGDRLRGVARLGWRHGGRRRQLMGLAEVVSTPRLTYPTQSSLTRSAPLSLPQPLTGGISSP